MFLQSLVTYNRMLLVNKYTYILHIKNNSVNQKSTGSEKGRRKNKLRKASITNAITLTVRPPGYLIQC